MTDIVVETFLLLKNNWSLTGDLATGSLNFGTVFYDETARFPQVCVSQIQGDPSPPLTMGSSGSYYRDIDILSLDIWVRPKTDSGTNLGWAKNTAYQLRKESERSLRSGSHLPVADSVDRFLWLGPWSKQSETKYRPVLIHTASKVNVIKFVKGV
jgi:hypothetical protein